MSDEQQLVKLLCNKCIRNNCTIVHRHQRSIHLNSYRCRQLKNHQAVRRIVLKFTLLRSIRTDPTEYKRPLPTNIEINFCWIFQLDPSTDKICLILSIAQSKNRPTTFSPTKCASHLLACWSWELPPSLTPRPRLLNPLLIRPENRQLTGAPFTP